VNGFGGTGEQRAARFKVIGERPGDRGIDPGAGRNAFREHQLLSLVDEEHVVDAEVLERIILQVGLDKRRIVILDKGVGVVPRRPVGGFEFQVVGVVV
jgi:hypothetical protein